MGNVEHIYPGLNLTKLNSACLLTDLDGIALLMNYSPFQGMCIRNTIFMGYNGMGLPSLN